MGFVKESSKVTLYSGVDITQGHQIAFASKAGQEQYFSKKEYSTAIARANFSYLRRTGKIKVGIGTADASKCDYMSFVNPSFENKIFYAKIVNYEYVNNNTTEITYSIDYFQTYMFDVQYEQGIIEREHLSESDYQKSVEYPFRRDVYELNTGEDMNISKEMEDTYSQGDESDLNEPNYNTGYANVPGTGLLDNAESCIVIQLADFDTSAMTDIESAFYSKFNMIIKSNGIVMKDDYAGVIPGRPDVVPISVGRGFGLYYIRGTSAKSMANLSDALEWLTYHGLEGQLVGSPYQISNGAWNAYIFHGTEYGTSMLYMTARNYNVHNKKLLRFPYQYIRVYNNEGDCKEYKYEMFTDNVLHDGSYWPDASFMYVPMLDGSPMISLVPFKYRRNGLNPEERIDITMIPQVGYTTDAYLAFLAQQYNMNLGSRTDTLSEGINQMIDSRAAKTARENVGAAGTDWLSSMRNQIDSAGNALGNLLSGNVTGAINDIGNISATSVREEASIWQSGGNYVYSAHLAPAEGAYVADQYHPGSTNGTLGYYLNPSIPGVVSDNRYAPGAFTVVRVKLLDQVLSVFDTYFSGFGYASGRYGTPRICAYIEGNSSHNPHFAPYFGKEVTYVKTNNFHVTHTISEVSKAIEDMFNSGVQFLKGEDL